MDHVTAKRTLVKSPPELWSELSEVDRLARHLEAFGEIKITKLEPEHSVAWEGEETSGTVSIEPSGWGTKVTLTATVPEPVPVAVPAPVPEPAGPVAVAEPELAGPEPEIAGPEPDPVDEGPRKQGFLARWFTRPRRANAVVEAAIEPPEPEAAPEPEPVPEPEAEPEPEPRPGPEPGAAHARSVLEDALEALGSAHHRPFSRG